MRGQSRLIGLGYPDILDGHLVARGAASSTPGSGGGFGGGLPSATMLFMVHIAKAVS